MRSKTPVSMPFWAGYAFLAVAFLSGLLLAHLPRLYNAAFEAVRSPLEVGDIAPNQFAVAQCSGIPDADRFHFPCFMVNAGGKRLQFGAPMQAPGIYSGQLDGLFLLSNAPDAILGVGQVRYSTWRAGRRTPLPLFGGDIVTDLAAGLDSFMSSPDAVLHIRSGSRLDFDGVILDPLPIPPAATAALVFDTGDLKVRVWSQAQSDGDQALAYLVTYDEQNLLVEGCGFDGGRLNPQLYDRRIIPVRSAKNRNVRLSSCSAVEAFTTNGDVESKLILAPVDAHAPKTVRKSNKSQLNQHYIVLN